jgi:hypothetical protein
MHDAKEVHCHELADLSKPTTASRAQPFPLKWSIRRAPTLGRLMRKFVNCIVNKGADFTAASRRGSDDRRAGATAVGPPQQRPGSGPIRSTSRHRRAARSAVTAPDRVARHCADCLMHRECQGAGRARAAASEPDALPRNDRLQGAKLPVHQCPLLGRQQPGRF